MDSFISTVEPQVVHLDGFDKIVSIMYIPRIYWFENEHHETKSWDTFMPPETLRSSFYRTLQDFPIIAGRFKAGKDGRGTVIVDRDNINMPIYTDSDWDVDFKQIKDAGFDTGLLPETFDNARGFTAASRFGTKSAKLGIFHVRRFKNYSGVIIFASITHGLVDGQGFVVFMNRWAEISKLMHKSPTEKVPARVFSHDRSIHNDYRQEGTSSLDDTLLKLTSGSSTVITRYAAGGILYSTNDVLTSLLAMTVGQAIQENNARRHARRLVKTMCSPFNRGNGKPEDTLLTIPTNLRPRISHPDGNKYVGNLMFARYIICPQTLTQADSDPENVLAVATIVREAMSSTDKTYIGQSNHLINREPDMYMRLATGYLKYKSSLAVTNVSMFDQYGLDFGAGIPRLIRSASQAFMNYIEVMPCHPDIGGYEVVMMLRPGIAQIIAQNKGWMRLVDSYHLGV
ncbi:hypothetical protein EV175_003285 [Coemansia sp. RSA 1933]|nr:hypothetical protein EV175_003285 [Coemansia sp. RSA 1933]